MWEPRRLTALWASTACYRDSFTFLPFGLHTEIVVKSLTKEIFFMSHTYGLDDRGVGVRVLVGSRIFSPPRRPDGMWGPPNLLSNGYRGGFLPGGKTAGA
jgi:hypothetical protein